MNDLEKGEKGSLSGSTPDKVSRPVPKQRSNCVLGFCRLVNFLTAICCLLCAVAHGMALMVGEGSVQASFARLLAAGINDEFEAHLTCSTELSNLTSLSGLQGVQALTQQVLRLYGVGFAIILGIQSALHVLRCS